MPDHRNPTRQDRTAHAPYNFIPLPDKIVRAQPLPDHDRYYSQPDRYTGTIICSMETKSPVYTRAMVAPDLFEEYSGNLRQLLGNSDTRDEAAAFFNHGDPLIPVIPGSSIRGMLRSIFEIITYSKVDWVTDQKLIFRAVGDTTSLGTHYRQRMLGNNQVGNPNTQLDYPRSAVKGGYLIRRGSDWYIQPAKEHLGETFVHVDYATAQNVTRGSYGSHRTYDVFVAPASRTASNHGNRGKGTLTLNLATTQIIRPQSAGMAPDLVPGVLIESGQMGQYPPPPGKHSKHMHCVIYSKKPDAQLIPIPHQMWAAYQSDLEISREDRNKPRELTNDSPLFYLVEGDDLVFFGPTMMFRLPYPHSPHDFIPAELRDPHDIDLTDAVFGYIRDESLPNGIPKHYAGRVKIGDARLTDTSQELWLSEKPIMPSILSSPKPTTFQHYLEQNSPDDRGMLQHYAQDVGQTKIRGHKLYWHRGNVGVENIQDAEANGNLGTQRTLIKPVKSGVLFKFKIEFENLTLEELGALLWVIKLPAGDNELRCHSIGMAKPFGLGAVLLKVENLILQDRKNRYTTLFYGNQWCDGSPISSEKSPAKYEDYLKAFEDYMKAALGFQGLFRMQPRIQMLVRMLKFPGPNYEETQYQNLHEFKERPVLPNPLADFTFTPLSNQSNSSGSTKPGELEIGSYVTVTVIDTSDPQEMSVELNNHSSEYCGIIRRADRQDKTYQEGAQIRCIVLEIIPQKNTDEIWVYLRVAPRHT